MKPPRALLFQGHSQYHVLTTFTDQMAKAFEELGCQVRVVDVNSPDLNTIMQSALQEGFDFVFTFNGIRLNLTVGNVSLFDQMNIPIIAALLDHPVYHMGIFADPVKNIQLTCVDRSHVDFIDKQLGNARHAFFLPHGACSGKVAQNTPEKNFDLLFGGTLRDPEEIRQQWQQKPDHLQQLANQMVDCLLEDSQVSLEKALERTFGPLEPSHPSFPEIISLIPWVDQFVRMTNRHKVLSSLAQQGVKILCCGSGSGWEKISWKDKPNVKLLKDIAFEKTIELMQQSHLTLNIMPGFTAGSHERILTAAFNSSLPVTDASQWLEEEFTHNQNIFFYNKDNIEELSDSLQNLLTHPQDLTALTQASQEKVKNHHTWKNRAKQVLNQINKQTQTSLT